MKKHPEKSLQTQLNGFQEQAQEYETILKNLYEKLAKADALRRTEPQKRAHWNRVLDQLEDSLDLIKARREHCQLAIQQIMIKLKESSP